jgi:serine/threonine protein kinase/DNA-binding SARP family transcriptional activator/WD40 repeat protein
MSSVQDSSLAPLFSGDAEAYGADMQIRVLGPVEVESGGVDLRLGGPKQRTILALLVAQVGKVVSVDALIDGLWGEEPTAGARSTLQTYISNLRTLLGDVIVREGGGYRLLVDAAGVDAVRFEEAVGEATVLVDTRPAEAAQRLSAALAFWRGHPYADVQGSFPLELEARRLEELRLGAIESRVEAELALGRHAELVPELSVLCSEFPFREGFCAQLMLALYRSGRQAEALRAFQKTRTALVEELGLDASARLRELEHRILNQDSSLVLEAEPRVETLAFLFTDIEDSTPLWETQTEAMRSAVARHDRIVRDAVDAAGGRIVKRVGDGIDIAFADVGAAVSAATEIQAGLAASAWPGLDGLTVRMAIDVGEVEGRGGDYFGPVLNRAGRMLAAAHGGQVLLSADAHGALASSESGWQAKALGEYRFKGIGSPLNVFQLTLDGSRNDFPPLRIDRLPPALPALAFGRSIRGYELREEIGEGDFAIVYRAYQPSIGREVAIKIIRAELVNQPSFVRGFEAEARLVAQLEHPHIVSLYDYWRDPEGAYLVMRWLRGGSLRDALDRGRWNLEPAARLVGQIADALSYAHRQGVLHGDLKPANVLLDDEGHGYLSDFGLASRLAAAPETGPLVASSPAYVSPEELSGEMRTARSDIYSFGLLAYELLTGRRPPPDSGLPSLTTHAPDLPAALDEVIATATAADPKERYATADAFLAAFAEACGTAAPAAEPMYTPRENPYKGLRPFDETDESAFHGREAVVAELVAAVADRRLVAVVGPSGIGKSSLVRAGLIPALRRGALPGSDRWLISDMFPGSYPYEELAAALLRVGVERPTGLADELARDELGIRRMAKEMLPRETELLLVIDQFEELFAVTADEEVRRRFLAALVALAEDARAGVRVVVAMRADFLDQPLSYPEFGELFKAGMVPVAVPSDDELAAAVERPAAAGGVGFEPGLVSRIVTDVRDQPGGLPLLQYALTELFAARSSDVLTAEGYEAVGGVAGAVGRRAEELWQQLDAPGQAAARNLFLRLVTVRAGAQDTRRRARRRELGQLGLDTAAVDEVLTRYGEHRLLTFDHDPATRSPTVEVAHEALLTQWERLRAWIEERREQLVLHRRLIDAVAEWEDAGRHPDYLPREGRLAQLEDWARTTDIALSDDETAFLEQGRRHEDERRGRARRRRRVVLAGFALAAVVAAALAALALIGRGEARRSAAVARSRELAASAVSVLDRDPELSVLLSVRAADEARPPFEAVSALHEALLEDDALWTHDRHLQKPGGASQRPGTSVWSPDWGSLSPDGHLLVVGAVHGFSVWNVDTHKRLWSVEIPHGSVPLARFSSDGSAVVGTTVWDPASSAAPPADVHPGVHVWDARSGREVRHLSAGPCPAYGLAQTGSFIDLARPFALYTAGPAPHGAPSCGSPEQDFFLLDPRTGKRTPVAHSSGLPPLLGLNAAATSADARYVAVSDLGRSRVVDSQTGRTVFSKPVDGPDWVALSADGTRVVTGGGSVEPLSMWDVGSGRLLAQFDTTQAFWFGFSHDERTLVSLGRDGVVRLWDVSTGHELSSLRGKAAGGTWAALDSSGARLASFGDDDSVRVWTLRPRGEAGAFHLGPGFYPGDALDVEGKRAAVETYHGDATHVSADVAVLDPSTGAVERKIRYTTGQVVRLSPDGRRLAAQEQVVPGTPSRPEVVGPVLVHDLETGKVTRMEGWCVYSPAPGAANSQCKQPPATPFRAWVGSMDFSPDGSLLAAGSEHGGGVSVWNAATGKLLFNSGRLPGDFWQVAFSPDGRRLVASTTTPTLIVYDTASWKPLVRRRFDVLVPAHFDPDGSHLVGAAGNHIVIIDTRTWRTKATLSGAQGQIKDLEISPDGTTIATADLTGLVRLWDLRSGKALQDIPFGEPVENVEYLDDRHLLVAPANGGDVQVLTLDVDELLRIARRRLTRGFTQEECRTYLHVDTCPSPAPAR